MSDFQQPNPDSPRRAQAKARAQPQAAFPHRLNATMPATTGFSGHPSTASQTSFKRPSNTAHHLSIQPRQNPAIGQISQTSPARAPRTPNRLKAPPNQAFSHLIPRFLALSRISQIRCSPSSYYALAAGAVSRTSAPRTVRRNMPDPVPVLVLGRLAVQQAAQGKQLGGALLQDAVLRAVAVSQNAAVRALLVHALNPRAQAFYLHYGFQPSPWQPLTLMLPLPAPKS